MTAFNKAWGAVRKGFDDQMETIYRVALGMAHQQILDGGEEATMEIWANGGPVMLAIDKAASQFAINPSDLQRRYDAHEFAEPGWRDDYHAALSELRQMGGGR